LLTIRIPVVWDLVRVPFDPILTSVLGQSEPYGGRSSLFVAVGLVAAALFWRSTPVERRRASMPLMVPSLVALVTIGIAVTRTRFTLYPVGLVAAGLAAFLGPDVTLGDRRRAWVPWFVRACVLLPLLDAARNLL